MSCNTEEVLHVGDFGTQFILTIKKLVDGAPTVVDVSGATTKKILFRDSEGTITEHTASFLTDGTDGKITYTTVTGDISISGSLEYRGFVVLSATQSYQSSTCKIKVYKKWVV